MNDESTKNRTTALDRVIAEGHRILALDSAVAQINNFL